MIVLAWNCRGLGALPAIRTLTEVVKRKNYIVVFLVETKASIDRMKGFQNKLGFTKGIIIPSDDRSDGLALLWTEGMYICFKSCSHSHIDGVVHGEGSGGPWRVIGFYGHLDIGKRYISWQLLETLNAQCSLPWLVCGDFNEIAHSNEKLGWKDRDAKQMGVFRETLSGCGLFDLGFVGPRFTWCNETPRFGKQRTLIRLDRMVTNEAWSSQIRKSTMFLCHPQIIVSLPCF